MEPAEGWHLLVELDGGFEEINDFFVLAIFGPVAGDVEGRIASRMLGEFVRPEVVVGTSLRDPVFVHVGQKIKFAKGFEKGADI